MKGSGNGEFLQLQGISACKQVAEVDDPVHMVAIAGEILAQLAAIALQQFVQQFQLGQ
jgi:hypothetical protein